MIIVIDPTDDGFRAELLMPDGSTREVVANASKATIALRDALIAAEGHQKPAEPRKR